MLRNELTQAGLDNFHAAQLLSAFLSARGYGVSNEEAHTAAARMASGWPIPALRRELEQLAYVM